MIYIHVEGLCYNFQVKLYCFPLQIPNIPISKELNIETEQFTNHSLSFYSLLTQYLVCRSECVQQSHRSPVCFLGQNRGNMESVLALL